MSRLAALLVLGIPIAASAHPLVDDGIERLEAADFEGAERAFAAAEAASDLTLADLVQLLEAQAVLHLGLHQPEELDRDLARLASIDPTHVFAPGRPPELAAIFGAVRRRVRERLHVQIYAQASPTGVSIVVNVFGDADGLSRRVGIHARTGDGPWFVGSSRELAVPALPGTTVEYWAEAIGPGGAPIATSGSADQPLRFTVPAAIQPAPTGIAPETPSSDSVTEERRGSKAWIWVTVAGVVVTVAAAAAIVYFVRSDETQPSTPSLSF